MLNYCLIFVAEVLRRRSQSNKKSLEENSLRFNNKAHVVKPHMVNGTVLHIPTINLTRVSDLHLQSSLRSNSKKDETNSSVYSLHVVELGLCTLCNVLGE